MNLEEKQYISVIYWIKNLFSSYSSVNVTEEYPEGELVLPTIAVIENPIAISQQELGNRIGRRNRTWMIELFALTRPQRTSMMITTLDAIEPGIPVYDYSFGFPPSGTPPQIGTLRVLPGTLVATPIINFPDLSEKLYWRASIKYITEYESIT